MESVSERLEEELDADLSQVPRDRLNNKDAELRFIYKKLAWRKFHIKYFFGRIHMRAATEPKSFGRGANKWYRRLEIRHITQGEITTIQNLIEDYNLSLAVIEHTQKCNDLYGVEIV